MDEAAGRTRTNVIAIPRRLSEAAQIRADDRLIEDLRAGRITDASPVHPVVHLLAHWRHDLLVAS